MKALVTIEFSGEDEYDAYINDLIHMVREAALKLDITAVQVLTGILEKLIDGEVFTGILEKLIDGE